MEEIFYMPHEKYNPHELLFTYEDMMDMFTKWDEENPDDQVPCELKFVNDLMVANSWSEDQGAPFVYAIELPLGFSGPVGDA
tara:strand:+ start:1035 stop:1280 length:246 start_codon:yes stop_codon:yes gene_type:complete